MDVLDDDGDQLVAPVVHGLEQRPGSRAADLAEGEGDGGYFQTHVGLVTVI